MSQPFPKRIDETRVAEILAIIAAPPNRRLEPAAGDLAGDFDFWFDGGAGRTHTGSQHYFFADGTQAHLVFPAPWLNLNIVFPNGEIVDVAQRRPRGELGEIPACLRLDRLES